MDNYLSNLAENPVIVTVENELTKVLANPISQTIVIMFLSLYAGTAAPQLEPSIQLFFSFTPFRLLLYTLLVYTTMNDLKVSLVAAMIMYFGAEMVHLDYLNKEDEKND